MGEQEVERVRVADPGGGVGEDAERPRQRVDVDRVGTGIMLVEGRAPDIGVAMMSDTLIFFGRRFRTRWLNASISALRVRAVRRSCLVAMVRSRTNRPFCPLADERLPLSLSSRPSRPPTLSSSRAKSPWGE
jgi:hypothetical protein